MPVPVDVHSGDLGGLNALVIPSKAKASREVVSFGALRDLRAAVRTVKARLIYGSC
jgi:hypothetical protein